MSKKDDVQFPDPDYKPDEKITVTTFDDLAELMEVGSVVTIPLPDGKKYYHLPFWFESVGGSWIIHDLNNLPPDLQDFLVKARMGGDNPQPKT